MSTYNLDQTVHLSLDLLYQGSFSVTFRSSVFYGCISNCLLSYTGEMGQHDKKMERQQVIGSIGQTISY